MNDFKKYLDEFDVNFNLTGEKEFSRLKKKIQDSNISINSYSKSLPKANARLPGMVQGVVVHIIIELPIKS